ncbi:hypothetical protein EVA_01862 [gut metagenome]|uniref:Uncharacterized protein n=1 Tax=gut metagenome TaxID=749906 RepID=J9H2G4_9ZZZZ
MGRDGTIPLIRLPKFGIHSNSKGSIATIGPLFVFMAIEFPNSGICKFLIGSSKKNALYARKNTVISLIFINLLTICKSCRPSI